MRNGAVVGGDIAGALELVDGLDGDRRQHEESQARQGEPHRDHQLAQEIELKRQDSK